MNGYLAVIDRLRADGPLGILIGGSGVTNARIFPGDAPQTMVRPYIRAEDFDSEPHDTKSGKATTDTDIVKVFACADTDSACYPMSTAIRNSLDGASGVFNGMTVEIFRYLRSDTYSMQVLNKSGTLHESVRVHEHDYEVRVRVNQ